MTNDSEISCSPIDDSEIVRSYLSRPDGAIENRRKWFEEDPANSTESARRVDSEEQKVQPTE